MAEFYDITKWSEKLWFQPGGTRDKVVIENPATGELYFFKTSLLKIQKDYKHEFWSEIIASEVGDMLGFDILKYNIGYNRGHIGCICKSMVSEGKNKLTEGISYLTGYDTTYNPEDKTSKKQYTFQLIKESLDFFSLDKFIHNIIEIIILDSIISNSDRHQENWGIITDYNEVIKTIEDIAKKPEKHFGSKLLFSIMAITAKAKRKEIQEVAEKLHLFMPGQFSQIYDSGSCLGREKSDKSISQMLKDSTMFEAYVRRGQSEIHWEGEKLNHFDLIRKIKTEYSESIIKCITRVKRLYDIEKIKELITNIDKKLPANLSEHKLPLERKEFINKLLTLRIEKLIEIIE